MKPYINTLLSVTKNTWTITTLYKLLKYLQANELLSILNIKMKQTLNDLFGYYTTQNTTHAIIFFRTNIFKNLSPPPVVIL